jgi:hypothetical protein
MKLRKMLWWLAVILLFFFATAFILYARQFGSMQFQLLNQLSQSIDRNPAAWEKIEIGEMDARIFHKSLWVYSNAMRGMATDSAVFFGILSLFLFITLQYEKRKNRKHTADGKT